MAKCKFSLPEQTDGRAGGAKKQLKKELKRTKRRAWKQYGEVVPDGKYKGYE